MELYINNPDDYLDSGTIDNEIASAIKKIENIKENINSSYRSLNSRTRNKVQTFSVADYDAAIEALNRLNNRRSRFASNMNTSNETMATIVDIPIELYIEQSTGEVKSLIKGLGYEESLVDGVSDNVLANYREENIETYKKLIGMYSALGPLTSQDLEQVLRAGNCAQFNQNSHVGLNLYFSGNPYATPTYGTSNPKRGIRNGGNVYASVSSSGCGPSTIRNIAGCFFGQNSVSIIDTIKATSDICRQNEINFSQINDVCQTVGLEATNLNLISGNRLDYDDVGAINALDNGELIILSKRLDSGGGHYVAVVGYKKIDDRHVEFLYLDPFNGDSSGNATFSFSSNTKINRGGYSVKPKEHGEVIGMQYHQKNSQQLQSDEQKWLQAFDNPSIYV